MYDRGMHEFHSKRSWLQRFADDAIVVVLRVIQICAIAVFAFGLLACLLSIPSSILFIIFCAMSAVGLVGSPFFILYGIRKLNQRDDPRHAKLPPDAP
jgi:hypothetical protein